MHLSTHTAAPVHGQHESEPLNGKIYAKIKDEERKKNHKLEEQWKKSRQHISVQNSISSLLHSYILRFCHAKIRRNTHSDNKYIHLFKLVTLPWSVQNFSLFKCHHQNHAMMVRCCFSAFLSDHLTCYMTCSISVIPPIITGPVKIGVDA